jgi:hypothetical protein
LKSFIAVVNSKTKEVPFWKVVSVEQADNLVDELREKYRTPPIEKTGEGDDENLKEVLWVEDDVYDYLYIMMNDDETAEDVINMHPDWKVGL